MYNNFIANLPATTVERESKIDQALDAGKIYATIVKKNGKNSVKLVYKNDQDKKTIKQLKLTPTMAEYLNRNRGQLYITPQLEEYLKK